MGTKYQGSKTDIRALNTWIKMTRASNSLHSYINQSLENTGISITQFGVLEMIFHLGPLPQMVISQKMLCSPGNITLVIDNLVRGGFAVRKNDPHDRRYHLISLTQHGRKLVQELLIKHVKNIVSAFSVLSDADQTVFSGFCESLGKHCETKKKESKS